jgi:hypothetical protein
MTCNTGTNPGPRFHLRSSLRHFTANTMTTSAQVLAQLDQLGSRLEEFDQAVRQREARLAPGQVDEGFCRGVRTDWLRRVIQGGNPSYDPTIQRVGAPAKPEKTPQVAADHKEQLREPARHSRRVSR